MQRRVPLFPLLLLLLLIAPLLLLSLARQPPPLPSPPCSAPTWLIGHSHSQFTLASFALHFHTSPPADLCILFSSPFPPPTPFIHTLPFPLSTLHLLAAHAGAARILTLPDFAALYTTRYGTGKGEVRPFSPSAASALLPLNLSTLHVRALSARPSTFTNPESILRAAPAFPRGAPLAQLVASAGRSATTFAKLPPAASVDERSAPIVHFFPNVAWDAHPLFARISAAQRHTFADVRKPVRNDNLASTAGADEEEGDDRKRAIMLAGGAIASLPASPTLMQRPTFWALAPLSCSEEDPDEDVIRGYLIQKTLHATGRGVLFVEPVLDVWESVKEDWDISAAMRRADRVDKVLETLKVLHVPQGMKTEDAFLWLGRKLAGKGIVNWCGMRAADDFMAGLRAAGVLDGTKTTLEKVKEDVERIDLAKTGVCVTGQMRSAPYTATNLISRLRSGVGRFETMIVTEQDDRVGSARLFSPLNVGWSRVPRGHKQWIERLLNSTVVHETMSTRTQLHNYLRQLADMRDCLSLIQARERERGRKFEYLVRVRPDTMLMNEVDSVWWEGKGVVVHSKRQSFYAMNDRFFAGDRRLMGRLLSCHDVFWWLVATGKVYDRKAGDATHMLWKKMINSEKFLARCASVKHVPLKAIEDMDVRRVAYSGGVATWREFYGSPS